MRQFVIYWLQIVWKSYICFLNSFATDIWTTSSSGLSQIAFIFRQAYYMLLWWKLLNIRNMPFLQEKLIITHPLPAFGVGRHTDRRTDGRTDGLFIPERYSWWVKLREGPLNDARGFIRGLSDGQSRSSLRWSCHFCCKLLLHLLCSLPQLSRRRPSHPVLIDWEVRAAKSDRGSKGLSFSPSLSSFSIENSNGPRGSPGDSHWEGALLGICLLWSLLSLIPPLALPHWPGRDLLSTSDLLCLCLQSTWSTSTLIIYSIKVFSSSPSFTSLLLIPCGPSSTQKTIFHVFFSLPSGFWCCFFFFFILTKRFWTCVLHLSGFSSLFSVLPIPLPGQPVPPLLLPRPQLLSSFHNLSVLDPLSYSINLFLDFFAGAKCFLLW